MRPEARTWSIEHFETFLRDPCNRDIAPVLVHGDFGVSNILYDAQQWCVTGVIDFSSAGPDDPAVDFAAASTLAPDILEHISSTYPAVQDARARVAFYRGTFALQEALFGIEHEDEAAFRAGIAGYM
jgi:aminoglycoside 2''-phosphotransferase